MTNNIDRFLCFFVSSVGLLGAAPKGTREAPQGAPWKYHVIDNQGKGSDGTKLADINGDGWLDVTTPWEEDGSTRVYLNPGPKLAKAAWPKVVVGKTPSAEDSIFADLDGDGNFDVVTSTEGSSKRVLVQWAPEATQRLDPNAWKQAVFPTVDGVSKWMFAAPLQLDGRNGVDLVIGGKSGNKTIEGEEFAHTTLGWLESPSSPRDVAAWKWHPLTEVDWTMSILPEDMDGDGDEDILFSNRFGQLRGIHWLENPGAAKVATGARWKKHQVGAVEATQFMFLATGDVDGDGRRDIAAAVVFGDRKAVRANPDLSGRILWFKQTDASGDRWAEHAVFVPTNTGMVKSVGIGDMDGDGRSDFVVSCEWATGERIGVYCLRQGKRPFDREWPAYNISGAPGIKYDLVRLLDLDGDGDLDVLTNEEREGGGGLGVVWYENPWHRAK